MLYRDQPDLLLKIMHKTRNLFRAKTAQKDSGFLILRYFVVPAAIAFLFCDCPI